MIAKVGFEPTYVTPYEGAALPVEPLYAVIPVTLFLVNPKYTGKSTLLQMWGHFILSKCL